MTVHSSEMFFLSFPSRGYIEECGGVSEHRTRLSLIYLHNFKQDLMSESSFCVKWELNLTLNYSQVNHEINTENSEHNKL